MGDGGGAWAERIGYLIRRRGGGRRGTGGGGGSDDSDGTGATAARGLNRGRNRTEAFVMDQTPYLLGTKALIV